MKILITTGLSAGDVGGPAQYGPKLKNEFERLGHVVKISQYASIENALLKIWPSALWADKIIALDTFSVGVPSVLASRLFGKKILIRVGGDFVWSAYVNRTSEPLTLPGFYQKMPTLNLKERIIFFFTKMLINNADFLAFNTEWQRNIWEKFYKIPEHKSGVVRNFIPEKREGKLSTAKNFLWAGRLIPEKNPAILEKFRIDIATGESHEKVLDRIKNCYVAVSLAFTDICPNFILEALSFNKPFIMTRETGLGELFPLGGIFVDPLNIEEIENAIEKMLDNNVYNRYVEELKSVNLRHSWGELASEFIDIWKRL
ncbi:MAG: hypothetical protein A2832_02340 [Candidatus Zambryskibacteria bacterium RIFCSPHIGHO2_01_FULL_44_22b]|uniref:Glycosyl transferase family 1 domain-containing protein n=1 Tax=Candidatus Zambryskibacteria bacterium RIFCSPHIGHO2_01_FULL_44_22b TaxID=1802737 RepID=A0A1G2T2B3_9BACT|nr:MAG: hypothetical protein A3A98_02495 [Candidatus Staskawiczbacteria bacterium RIFCSPLOWO2_01_FULL_40_39]OHA91425.1 MAG: hypothetical protein A2832_02340 [Candidatus Zambryskibacteria bacterium RIFCSPHIGHO2_01_FULL_44_22b]